MNKDILDLKFDQLKKIYKMNKLFIENWDNLIDNRYWNEITSFWEIQKFWFLIRYYLIDTIGNFSDMLKFEWIGEDFSDSDFIIGIRKNSFGDYFFVNQISELLLDNLIKNNPFYYGQYYIYSKCENDAIKDLLQQNSFEIVPRIRNYIRTIQSNWDTHQNEYTFLLQQ